MAGNQDAEGYGLGHQLMNLEDKLHSHRHKRSTFSFPQETFTNSPSPHSHSFLSPHKFRIRYQSTFLLTEKHNDLDANQFLAHELLGLVCRTKVEAGLFHALWRR